MCPEGEYIDGWQARSKMGDVGSIQGITEIRTRCTNPNKKLKYGTTRVQTVITATDGECNGANKCEVGEGHCTDDTDCKGPLKCSSSLTSSASDADTGNWAALLDNTSGGVTELCSGYQCS